MKTINRMLTVCAAFVVAVAFGLHFSTPVCDWAADHYQLCWVLLILGVITTSFGLLTLLCWGVSHSNPVHDTVMTTKKKFLFSLPIGIAMAALLIHAGHESVLFWLTMGVAIYGLVCLVKRHALLPVALISALTFSLIVPQRTVAQEPKVAGIVCGLVAGAVGGYCVYKLWKLCDEKLGKPTTPPQPPPPPPPKTNSVAAFQPAALPGGLLWAGPPTNTIDYDITKWGWGFTHYVPATIQESSNMVTWCDVGRCYWWYSATNMVAAAYNTNGTLVSYDAQPDGAEVRWPMDGRPSVFIRLKFEE
jgi:hypothetical protein